MTTSEGKYLSKIHKFASQEASNISYFWAISAFPTTGKIVPPATPCYPQKCSKDFVIFMQIMP